MVLAATMSHTLDMPPFHDPLNVGLLKMAHELCVRFKALEISKPTIPNMPRKVGVKGYKRGMKQSRPFL